MSIVTRREREKEQTRLQILVAAERVFARHGFHKTTMDAIAAESEWSKGALYLHFKSKEELFFSLLLERLADFGRLVNTAIQEADSLDAAIRILVHEQFDFYQQNLPFFQLIISEQGKLMMASDEGFRAKLFAQQRQNMTKIATHVKRLSPPSSMVSAQTLVLSIIGAINVHMMNWIHSGEDGSQVISEEEITTLFLKGGLYAE